MAFFRHFNINRTGLIIWSNLSRQPTSISTPVFRFVGNILPNNDSSVKIRKKYYISQNYYLKFLYLLHITPKRIIITLHSFHKLIAYHHVCWFYSCPKNVFCDDCHFERFWNSKINNRACIKLGFNHGFTWDSVS